jgi:hypothetical protein
MLFTRFIEYFARMNQLKIFISSTCYDLSQLRADLHDFISGIGHQAVMSEHSSFPIDPDNDTIENCIQNVATADLLILVLGNRYGHKIDSGKSITNTEYLYAKQNGIPVYIFIYKPLISILPIWKGNKNADFSSSVDSTKVFEFVDELRNNNKSWCFDFEKAQDIVPILKVQFSHLFKQSLDLRKKYRISDQPEFYKHLSPIAINIALKKEFMFETLFFIQVLKDEIEKYEDLKLDLEYKILTNCSREISNAQELTGWMKINFSTITHLTASLDNLLNKAYKVFKRDLKGLFYVACGIAKIFKEMTLWSINIKSTKVDDDFVLLRDTLSDFPALCLDEIWKYPTIAMAEINQGILDCQANPDEAKHIKVILEPKVDDSLIDIFNSEMERLSRKLG